MPLSLCIWFHLSWTSHLNVGSCFFQASVVAQLVKNLPAGQETWVWSLDWEDPLENGKATHSSILAWRILWTAQTMGSQSAVHNWATFTFTLFPSFLDHTSTVSWGPCQEQKSMSLVSVLLLTNSSLSNFTFCPTFYPESLGSNHIKPLWLGPKDPSASNPFPPFQA